ncbi:MAG: FtsX-like permease family protein [Bdellovibrionota bacterium]
MNRSSFWRFWLKNELKRKQTWFLGLLIAVGISGIVFVDLFAQRISKTSEQDARNFVAADFIVQSWRDFDRDLLSKVTELVPRTDQIWHQSLLAGARDSHDKVLNITIEALEGDYPFYGKWKLEHSSDRIEALRERAEVYADPALEALGYQRGDVLEIGGVPFRIRDFVTEDPQSLSFMTFSAYRIWMHRTQFQATALAAPGSRILNRLYLRKPNTDAKKFREEFRKKISDPNWRLKSAQQSDAQVQKAVGLLKSFLSFIALCGTFLGLAGIFMIFVADLRQRLPQFLTLRCLGVKESELKKALLAPAILSIVLAALLGSVFSWFLEARVARVLAAEFKVVLSGEPNPLRSFLLALATGLLASLPALSTPIARVMRIPVNRLFSGGIETSLLKSNLSWRSLTMMGGVALGLATLLSGSIKLSAINLLFVTLLVALLYALSRGALKVLEKVRTHNFILSYLVKNLARQRERSLLWLLSLGFGFFFLLLGLMVSQSLQKQLRIADATGTSNLVVMGSGPDDLEKLRGTLPATYEQIAYFQARIYAVNGETIQEKINPSEANADEDGSNEIRVREYFVNVRDSDTLYPGENLQSGHAIFGPKLAGEIVRASFEKDFAERLGLKLGESVQLEVAGIPLRAQVVSLRTVDWFQFRPNFFISLNVNDLEGAPLTYLQLLKVPDAEIGTWQSKLIKTFPHLTTIDVRRSRDQILGTLDRLSLSIQGATGFLLAAAVLVLIAIFLARRGELKNEFALLRCLGVRTPQLNLYLIAESLLSACLAWLGAFVCALPGAWALVTFGLQASFSLPSLGMLATTLALSVVCVLVSNLALNRRLMKVSPQLLFSEE